MRIRVEYIYHENGMTSRRFSIQFSVGSNSMGFPKMKELEEVLLVPDLNMSGTREGDISSFGVLDNSDIVVTRVKEILDGLHVKLARRNISKKLERMEVK